MRNHSDIPDVSVGAAGSLIREIATDLRNLRSDPAVRFYVTGLHYSVFQDSYTYRPPGLYAKVEGGPGRPVMYRLPPPHHPLELICAIRGFGGLEDEDSYTTGPDGVRALTDHMLHALVQAADIRYGTWAQVTGKMAKRLFLSQSQVRVLYHLLTPLNTNGLPPGVSADGLIAARRELYRAAGVRESEAEAVAGAAVKGGPCRMQFWGDEVKGVVTL